mgnify:CR=1 FL=1
MIFLWKRVNYAKIYMAVYLGDCEMRRVTAGKE